MMALSSIVKKSKNQVNLKFFSPSPFKESSGVNVFSQDIPLYLSPYENYYVFPPFILVGTLLNFLRNSQAVHVTIIEPGLSPRKFWWPMLTSFCTGRLKIGSKGQRNVLLFPPSARQGWHFRPLPWGLLACLLADLNLSSNETSLHSPFRFPLNCHGYGNQQWAVHHAIIRMILITISSKNVVTEESQLLLKICLFW